MKSRKKKKTSASEKKNSRKKHLRSAEVIGLIVLLFAVFTFISLLSYDAHDPSWASVTSPGQRTHNYGGTVGASLAETFLQVFGLGAFILPLIVGYLGIKAILPRTKGGSLLRIGRSLFLLLVLGALFSLLFGRLSWRGADIEAGGVLGAFLSSFLVRYLSQAGTLIFLLALLMLFVLFSTELSLGKLLGFSGRILSFAFKEVRIRVTDYRKSRAKEKMRKKVSDKYTQPLDKGRKTEEKKEEEPKPKEKKEEKKEIKRAERPEPLLVHPPQPARPDKLLFPEMGQKGEIGRAHV